MNKRDVIGMIFSLFAVWMFASLAISANIPAMSRDDLKAMLGDPDLVILDVRAPSDWRESNSKIKGAVREEPNDVASWAEKYSKGKTFVLY